MEAQAQQAGRRERSTTRPSPRGTNRPSPQQVKAGVIWRSGSQMLGQLIAWTSTFLVIRLLDPADYGLVAMTGVVLTFLTLFNGWGFASSLVRDDKTDRHKIGQAFGMLILMNARPRRGAVARRALCRRLFPPADGRRPAARPGAVLPRQPVHRARPRAARPAPRFQAPVADRPRRGGDQRRDRALLRLCRPRRLDPGRGARRALVLARAIGYVLAARLWQIRPRFRFEGAGTMLRYGTAMVAVQACWFAQSQADMFIAGRVLDPHRLGLYTTALFLTQILAAKFVPPLNEVAFAAYSRIQARPDMIQSAFLKSVRLIMLVALPFYFGLAVTAEPLVLTCLGAKWAEAAPLVPILAMAMPLMTLQILFAPASNALGRPGMAVRTGLVGAVLLPLAFLAGIQWGIEGLAWAWLGGMSVLLAATVEMSLPVIGISRRALFLAVAPGLAASRGDGRARRGGSMRLLPAIGTGARLAMLVAVGDGRLCGAAVRLRAADRRRGARAASARARPAAQTL